MPTLAEIFTEVWDTHTPRELDGQSPAASNGTDLDDIRYAFWTYEAREVENPPSAPSSPAIGLALSLGIRI